MLPPRLPYSGAHWVDHVARHAFAIPDSVAIRYEGESITWARLHDRVRRLAAGLAGQGVKPGDRVAVLMTNRPEFLEAVLAANAIGAIAVPVNFRLAPAEAAYVLQDSGAALVVTDSLLAPLAAAAAAAAAAKRGRPPRIIVTGPAQGAGSYEALLAGDGARRRRSDRRARRRADHVHLRAPPAGPRARCSPTSTCSCRRSPRSVPRACTATTRSALSTSPLFHIAGIGAMAPLAAARRHDGDHADRRRSTPSHASTSSRPSGVTALFLVPAQWQVLCADPDVARRDRSLRTISLGRRPGLGEPAGDDGRDLPGGRDVAVFGQTEMSPVTLRCRARDAMRKIGSVGTPIPTVAARIVDDEMNDVAPGQVGEIVYRGPTLMAGYWNNPEATAEAFARRLVPLRRPGPRRRRGLHLRRRPQEGHDHLRRREHLLRRGRERAVRPPGGRARSP